MMLVKESKQIILFYVYLLRTCMCIYIVKKIYTLDFNLVLQDPLL